MEMTVKKRQAEADSDDQLYDNLQQDGAYTDVHAPLLSAESCNHDNSNHDNRATFRLEEAVEFMGFGRFQIMMIFFMGMFSSSDAMEMMLIAILSPVLRCEWWLENWQVALFTTMVFVGMLIFSLPFGSLADRRGRWPVLWMSAFGVSYFGFLTTFSPTYMWVLVLRTLVGVSFAASPQGNTLLMEFLPSKFRAKVAVTFQLFWAAGSTLEIMLAYLVVPTLGWRYLVAFSCVPMTVVLLLYRFIPESARYCLAAGQRGKAMDILNRIARMNRTTLPPGTLVKSAEAPRGTLKELTHRKYRRTLLQDMLLWCGVGCLYYGIILVSSEITKSKQSCWDGDPLPQGNDTCACKPLTRKDYTTMIVATYGEFLQLPINLVLVDLIGRKFTLGVNLALVAGFYFLLNLCTTPAWVTFFVFGIRAFSAGSMNLVYLYTTEFFPTTVRALAIGTCSAVARLGAMLTPFVAQVLLNQSLSHALYVYAGIALVCSLTAFLLPYDTKGRALVVFVTAFFSFSMSLEVCVPCTFLGRSI